MAEYVKHLSDDDAGACEAYLAYLRQEAQRTTPVGAAAPTLTTLNDYLNAALEPALAMARHWYQVERHAPKESSPGT